MYHQDKLDDSYAGFYIQLDHHGVGLKVVQIVLWSKKVQNWSLQRSTGPLQTSWSLTLRVFSLPKVFDLVGSLWLGSAVDFEPGFHQGGNLSAILAAANGS